MKTFIFLMLLSLSFVCSAQASEWSLQLNGRAIHYSDDDQDLNENNLGLGVQYAWESQGLADYNFYTAGTLINSLDDRSWYAGGGKLWRLVDSQTKLDVGFVAGLATYPSADPSIFPAILPMASFGTEKIAMNIIYIPKIGDDVIPAFLLQLKIRLVESHD